MSEEQKLIVKVCTHTDCAARGSEALFEKLRAELHDEALVLSCPDCFGECEKGPNISITGTVLHHVTPETAVERIRRELEHPSLKSDGAGTRSLDELDRVLDEATRL